MLDRFLDLDPIFADTLRFFRNVFPELKDGTPKPYSLERLIEYFLNESQGHDALQDVEDLKLVCRSAWPKFSITKLKRFYQWDPYPI